MSIKSLLLGSAAAMMAVTGANAADAVFAAEPEPMDYVKICDTYGNGFYYIPGTETCLSINGYVRVEYIYTDLGPNGDTGNWVYRGRLNIDARNETDWGTLRSQLRLQGDGNGSADANVGIDRALISLGGMRLGYSDSYHTTHHGYGWQKAANDGYYGYDQAIFLDYTFAANGFSATIGIQDTNNIILAGQGVGSNIDFYAGAAYSASWGRIAASILYDNGWDEINYKASIDIRAIENLGIHAWYMADEGTTYQGTDWQWGVDVNYQVNAQFNVWVGYTDQDTVADTGRFGIGAIWNPVSGLSIRPEAVFGDDYTQIRLRVVRSF